MYPPFSTVSPSAEINRPQEENPTSGGTSTAANDTDTLLINPAGTLALLTIVLPSAPARGNGHRMTLLFSQVITALTLTSSATILGGVTTVSANGYLSFVFFDGVWYRAG